MKSSEFSKELKKWRGKRRQKEVAALIDVSLRTYEGWEIGHIPSRFAQNEIRRLMSLNPETL
jgi:ABC-type polysaccharide/polyol phosphate transport system ATPase subunit